jgi:hypothetical protein
VGINATPRPASAALAQTEPNFTAQRLFPESSSAQETGSRHLVVEPASVIASPLSQAGDLMQVWIGFKQNEEYVHEWTGEVAGEAEVGKAIGNAIAEYRTKSGKTIWGMAIMVDKARPL